MAVKNNDAIKTVGAAVAGAAVGAAAATILSDPKKRKQISQGIEKLKDEVEKGKEKLLGEVEEVKAKVKSKAK